MESTLESFSEGPPAYRAWHIWAHEHRGSIHGGQGMEVHTTVHTVLMPMVPIGGDSTGHTLDLAVYPMPP